MLGGESCCCDGCRSRQNWGCHEGILVLFIVTALSDGEVVVVVVEVRNCESSWQRLMLWSSHEARFLNRGGVWGTIVLRKKWQGEHGEVGGCGLNLS